MTAVVRIGDRTANPGSGGDASKRLTLRKALQCRGAAASRSTGWGRATALCRRLRKSLAALTAVPHQISAGRGAAAHTPAACTDHGALHRHDSWTARQTGKAGGCLGKEGHSLSHRIRRRRLLQRACQQRWLRTSVTRAHGPDARRHHTGARATACHHCRRERGAPRIRLRHHSRRAPGAALVPARLLRGWQDLKVRSNLWRSVPAR